MKWDLTTDLVAKISLDKYPKPGVAPDKWAPTDKPNYVVYDASRKAPTGFALRVGKNASVFIIEKLVAGKNMKIHVGLARGRKGTETLMPLERARDKARELVAVAKKHGVNPNVVADRIDAAELTLGQVWDRYIADLMGRAQPIKPNSKLSIDKARDKLADWEGWKVRMLTGEQILSRFDKHAVTLGHKTAAEAMGRWATAAVSNAIENEVHNAHAEGRPPSLTYNPFTILKTKAKYRTNAQLERDYKAKGVRNPLSFASTIGPFVKAAWEYRRENPVAADYLLIDLMFGMRGDECRTFKWRDQISDADAVNSRWIDMKARLAYVADAKNRGDHEFPIGPCALALLKLRRLGQPEGTVWVFPARSGDSLTGHYSDPTVALATVRDRAGIKTVRGHDLRRTFGKVCEKLGFSDRQIKRLLGHSTETGETVGRYTVAEMQDVRDRMERVEELIVQTAPSVWNALRPRGAAKLVEPFEDDIVIELTPKKARPPRGETKAKSVRKPKGAPVAVGPGKRNPPHAAGNIA